jgi:putative MATE family efflux protein
MTKGNPARQMALFALPVVAGGVLQQLYNAADSVIAGRLIGSGALAAVSNAGTVVFFITIMFLGIGNGASIIISHYFGSRDEANIRTAVDTASVFLLAGGLFSTVVGIAASPFVLRLLGTPEVIFHDAWLYLCIIFLGSVPSLGYSVLAAILNAVGDSRTPLYLLIFSTSLNVALDLIFVACFNMGVAGLAAATVAAQTLAFLGCALWLNRSGSAVAVHFAPRAFRWEMLKRIIKVGFPTGLQDALMIISIMVLQNRINSFGVTVIAGRSIVGKLEGFLLLPVNCLGTAVMTYTGQNTGAGERLRLRSGLKAGFIMMAVMSCLLCALVLICGEPLLRLFSSDPGTLAAGRICMWVTIPCYSIYSLAVVWQAFFRGSGDTLFPLALALATQFAFRILTIDLFLKFWPTPSGIWYTYVASWFLMFILDTVYYKTGIWKRFAGVAK